MRKHSIWMLGLVCSLVVLALAPAATILAGPGGKTDPRVFPPQSNMSGASYSEWSARWWQWAYATPVSLSPLFDDTGANVASGQSGDVWFLGGTFVTAEINGVFVGEADRTCQIPAEKKLFFPIMNTSWITLNLDGSYSYETDAEVLAFARYYGNFILPENLTLEIDGKPVDNLADYRVASPLFQTGPLPVDNILGIPAAAGKTPRVASDGYYVMLKPLSVGTHTIHFTGFEYVPPPDNYSFRLDITYHITVVPAG